MSGPRSAPSPDRCPVAGSPAARACWSPSRSLAAACGSSKKGGQTAATTSDGNSAAADEGTPVDGGSLVIGVAAETNGWNPPDNQWADTGSLVGSSVLEPLATIGADKGAKPWLADSWYAERRPSPAG